jgi:hypothetical protein
MDLQYFQNLNPSEARQLLEEYLELQSANIIPLLETYRLAGGRCGYTTDSVTPFFTWLVDQLTVVRKAPDSSLPGWILDCPTYSRFLFHFDDPSNVLILRASYYLGESFVSEFSGLSWGLGNQETVEANMPVVVGFRHGLEMATLLVTENLFLRTLADPENPNGIETAVNSWRLSVP